MRGLVALSDTAVHTAPCGDIEENAVHETVSGLAVLGGVLTARLLCRWIGGRTRVQLARLHQQGTSDRVRALPPGSELTERRADEELRIRVGGAGRDARG